MVKIGEKFEVIGTSSNHRFEPSQTVSIIRILADNRVDCVDYSTGDCSVINIFDLKTQESMKLMKQAVQMTANKLCQANNTVSTLEIKTELRKTHPYFHWIQNSKNGITGVSEYMDQLQKEGHFTFTTNGDYRVYSAVAKTTKKGGSSRKLIANPTAKPATHNVRSISRQKAFDMMANNKGHFFTATFVKQDGTTRTINCQYLKNQVHNATGYVMVREAGKMKQGVNAIRQINLQTLQNIRIGGQNYNIKK